MIKLSRNIVLPALVIALATAFFIWFFLKEPAFPDSFPALTPLEMPATKWGNGNHFLRGKLQDANGTSVAGGWVFAVGPHNLLSSRCEENGSFAFEGIQEGAWEITGSAPGYYASKIAAKAPTESISIQLKPLEIYGGGPDAKPSAEKKYSLLARLLREDGPVRGFAVALLPAEGELEHGFFRVEAGQDGIFEISQIPAGNYKLLVLSAAKLYDLLFCYKEMHISIGEGKTTPDQIEFASQEIRGVVLGPREMEFGATLPSAPKIENARISLRLLREGKQFSEAGFAHTNAEGEFRFLNLPQGDYEIFILATGYELFSQRILFTDPAKTNLQLTLTPKKSGLPRQKAE